MEMRSPPDRDEAEAIAQLLQVAAEMESRQGVVGRVQLRAWAERIRAAVARISC
jgi:hypothetical protein